MSRATLSRRGFISASLIAGGGLLFDLAVPIAQAADGTPFIAAAALTPTRDGSGQIEIITGRLMSGQPNAGVGFELDAIAAVVLGGTAIAGGRGLILGTLIGAVLLGILNNGLNLMGINPYLQDVIKGGIILLAIYIGREWR